MNNFTKSNGKAYWQSITNLACCVNNVTRNFKLSAMSSMLVMLFLFSMSTLQAQKVDQIQQRTVDLPLCYDQIPDPIPVEDIALLYEEQCGDLEPTVVIADETFSGDDCGWEAHYLYFITCGDFEAFLKIEYNGFDQQDPIVDVEAMDMTVECDGEGNLAELEAWLGSNGGASASDNCDDELDWTNDFGQFSDDCGLTGSVTVTFTATDECGMSASTTATFTIVDTTDPVIEGGSDLTVECDGEGNGAELEAWLESNAGATASDLCGDVEWSNNFDGLSDDCGETGSATVEFTATDDCGNSAKVTYTFTIEDTTDPTIDVEAMDMTVECDGNGNGKQLELWLNSNGGAQASDLCGDVTWSKPIFSGLSDDCGATGSATATFTAVDSCGNSSTTTATFTIEDTTDPTITVEAMDMTVECDGNGNGKQLELWLNSNGGAQASDACGSVTWSKPIFSGLSDECGATGSATATFTAVDECGNSSTTTATFTIEDTTDPVISGGADLTVECDGLGNAADLEAWLESAAGASASDACGDVEWSNNFDGLSDDCGETGSATVEFTATDECGNTAKVTFTFTIEDTTDPVIEGGSDLTVECDGEGNGQELSAWLASNAGATASDLCGEVEWSNNFDGLSDDCGATGSATVTFTATDDCDNTSSVTYTFTIEDTTDPTIDIEAKDEIVECKDSGDDDNADTVTPIEEWLANNGGAVAKDTCGGVTWSNDFDGLSDECGNTGSATVTFTATDDCGNSSSTTATYTIIDTTNPIIEGGSDLTVECDGAGNAAELDAWLASNAGASAFDSCGDVTWSNNFDGLSDDCGETGSATVEFTATDDCGNSSKVSFTFTIEDTTDPVIEGGSDLTVECDGAGNAAELAAWLESNAGASASDTCGGVTWSNDFEGLSDDCGATGSATVTFTATDDCGNTASVEYTFTIEDTTNPSIDIEAKDLTVECDGEGNQEDLEEWLANNGGAVASDLCGDVTWSHNCGEGGTTYDFNNGSIAPFSAIGSADASLGYVVLNGVSNATASEAEVEAFLNLAPGTLDGLGAGNVFDGSAMKLDVSVQAGDELSFDWDYILTDGGDFNDVAYVVMIEDGVVVLADTFNPGPEGFETFNHTFANAGNCVLAFGVSNVEDTAFDTPLYIDNVVLSSEGSECAISDECGETGSVTVEFTATDSCGNTAKTTATFTVEDTTDPVIEGGMDMTVECDGLGNEDALEAWLESNAGASASDTCGGVEWSNNFDGLSDDCGATGSATVTFTATDDCGNTASVDYTFTIEDTKNPVIEGGDDLTVECDGAGNAAELAAWLESNAGATASDECGSVTWSNDFSGLSDDCGATGSATVEFTATDECGNTDKVSFTFTIEDTTDPVIEGGMDMTVECDGAGNAAELAAWLSSNAGATASDTCGGVTWSNDFDGLSDDCGATGSATVTFTATDDCGNTDEVSYTFTIVDTTDPSIDTEAMDMTVECDGAGNQADLDAWLANNGGAVASDACGDVTWSYACDGTSTETGSASGANTTVTDIPDADDAGVTTTANVSGVPAGATVTDVRVDLSVEHTWVGDLTVNLTAPTGETLNLVTKPGNDDDSPCCGDSSDASGAIDGVITFRDDAVVLAEDMGATILGGQTICIDDGICDYVPNTGSPLFADLIAEMISNSSDPNGDWSLTVSDSASGDTGAFSWAIEIDYEVEGEGGECVLSDECGATGSVTVEFTATDSCGNTSKTTATFTVEDTTDPVIEGGMDMTVECDGQGNAAELAAWLESNAGASASDTCGDVEWSNNFDGLSDDCGATGSATVTFTATDDCGNTASVDYTFTIEDTTDPVIEGGMDMTVECDGAGNAAELAAWLESNAGASASDTCGGVEWSNDFDGLSDDCGATGSATVTFTATDDCGNTASVEYTFTIEDTTDPVIDEEAMDMTVECDGTGNQADLDAWIANNGGASASDLCGDVSWSHVCDNSGTSETGSASGANTTVTAIPDNSPAGVTTTANVSGVPAGATVTDVRVDLSVEHTWVGDLRVTLTAPTGEELLLVSRPGEDDEECCGDSSNASGAIDGVITFRDDAVVLAEDMGATINGGETICIDDGICDYVPNTGSPLFADLIAEMISNSSDPNGDWSLNVSDNAGGDLGAFSWAIEVDYETGGEETECVISDECGNTGSVTVTFIATDSCGNTAETTATFTVEDTIAPVQVLPTPPSINDINACMDDMPAPPTEEEIAALFEEACGDVIVTLFTSAVGDDCGWSVIHKYSIEDECGNEAPDVKIYYSGADETDPVLEGVPADVTVECDDVPAPAVVTATDNCAGPLDVDYDEVREDGNCPYNYTLIRTWSAVDTCGNDVSASQTITVQDTTAPTPKPEFEEPVGENFIEACMPTEEEAIENYGPSADEIAAMFNDNCGEVQVDKVVNINGDDCKWIMDIRYDIYDECGNYYEPSIKIWFHGMDKTAPEQVACENETFTLYTSDGAVCPDDAAFSLSVGDMITPADDWSVAGLFVQADLQLSIAPCFVDNCTATEDLRFEVMAINDGSETDECPNTMTITFNVLDLCDNTYEGFTCTFIVIDDEAPVLDCPEDEDLGFNPPSDPQTGIPYGLVDKVPYTDNCDDAGMTFDFVDDLSSEEGVPFNIDLITDCWEAYYTLDPAPDAFGFPTWTGFFPPNPGGVYKIAYNHTLGQWEETEDGFAIFWQQTTDMVPSCDIDDWEVIPNLSCDPDTAQYVCYNSETEHTLVRTFKQSDDCGNVGECSVTYTWTTGDVIAAPNSSNSNINDGGETVTLQRIIIEGEANDASVELDFTAFPVPFDKEVNVKFNFEFDTDVTIEVHDTKGLLVYSETVTNVTKGMNTTKTLDLSNGADQIFYVTLHTNQGSVTKKLVSSGLKRR